MMTNILSLCDGMSCGQLALNRAGIEYGSYYASEIDKFAIAVTQDNFPNTKQLGDMENWRSWNIDWSSIGLVIGGTPCQGFSFAGKHLAFADERSKLFYTYRDILDHVRKFNPDVKFILENVKMKNDYLAIITSEMGVKPVFINSQLVSAHYRQRYYWSNIEYPEIIDKGIKLSSILERGFTDRNKAYSISARYFKAGNLKRYATKFSDQLIFECGDHLEERQGFRLATPEDLELLIATRGDQFHDFAGRRLFYRKLTPIECERLQTVPDNYTQCVSNTQRYRMLGNGWTVDVIAHILSNLKW